MKIHNPPNVAPGGGYSHGIELPANARIIYCAGQLGLKTDGTMAGDDIRSQAEQAWRNIGAVLSSAGMGNENIVKLTHYLTRREDIPAYREVRAQFLGKLAPASTLLVISALARPEALIEVDVVAAKE
ncbi:MAG TPA: RidA family protein [Stellaceae bacterium]|jgi:enamine deaminase RidA (YjgF/YER057c/UK114 family)|nr:RidA family protein [Stellaceae bacterium]